MWAAFQFLAFFKAVTHFGGHSEEWNMGERAEERIDLSPLCYSSQKSLSPLCDGCLLFIAVKNGNRSGLLSSSQPHLSLHQSCLSACMWKEPEKGMLTCWWYRQTKVRRSALSLPRWRHEVHSCQKYLTSIYERSLQRTKKGGVVEGRKVDIDQMHVQTNSCQAQHTKNNVAWATLAPRVWCVTSEFFWIKISEGNLAHCDFIIYYRFRWSYC